MGSKLEIHDIGEILDIGVTPRGHLRVIPITGGTFTGNEVATWSGPDLALDAGSWTALESAGYVGPSLAMDPGYFTANVRELPRASSRLRRMVRVRQCTPMAASEGVWLGQLFRDRP